MDRVQETPAEAAPANRWEAQSLLLGRVRDVGLRDACLLAPETTMREAARLMAERGLDCVLVGGPAGPGIVTGTDMRNALALDGLTPEAAIGGIARRPLVAVGENELLVQALVLMDRHGKRRLAVAAGDGSVSGVLEQADLLHFLSDHSQAIATRIRQAERPEDLKPAFAALLRLIGTLHRNGVRTENIGQLASELNAAIFRRAFELVMPPEVQANTCLVVMGSEGRREQILPTDQDNALVVRDGFERTDLPALCANLSSALIELGYPPCPGKIMVSNPEWVMSETGFRERVSKWIWSEHTDSVMNLAIFFDGHAVAGDAALVDGVKAHLLERLGDRDSYFARFAAPINMFPPPLNVFSRFRLEREGEHAGMLDLKKGGIFPLVHGVRSLALEKRLPETGTLQRIRRLQELGALDRRFVRELAEAFEFLSSLRARNGLLALADGRIPDTYARPADLTSLDRDMLRVSFRVVLRLRELIRHHFRLDVLGL